MRKYKELLKNIGVLTLSNLGSKLLAFFLVPLYTAILSTEEFGNYDIVYTTITLLIPILTVNVSEGAMRFLLDKNTKKESICKKSISITNASIVVVILATTINALFHLIPFFEQYGLFFILLYATTLYSMVTQNIARGLNRIKDISFCGLLNSVIMLSLNILFLVQLRMGLNGYFLAGILSNGIAAMYLIIKCRLYIFMSNVGYFKKPKEKELISYSRPLVLNSISWWINDVSDRYMVTFICGVAVNGIYSVAYKIPTMLSLVHGIFNQAWLISVTKEYKQKKNIQFVKNTYKAYSLILVIGCSVILVLNKMLAKILYKGDFYDAWQYVPFLLVSAVFAAIGSAISIIFAAEKNSIITARTTVVGAIINILLNIILIKEIGALGAAIATAASSFTVWAVRLRYSKKYLNLGFSLFDALTYSILIIQAILFMIIKGEEIFWIEITLLLAIIALNIGNVSRIITKRKRCK